MSGRAIIIALMVVAVLLVPGIYLLSDLARPDTYGASLGTKNSEGLAALRNKTDEAFGASAEMQGSMNDTSIASASSQSDLSTPIWGRGWSAIQTFFKIPDIIVSSAAIIISMLPFDVSYLIWGLAGIVGFIVLLVILKVIFKVDL